MPMQSLKQTTRKKAAAAPQEERPPKRRSRVRELLHSLFFSGPSFLGMLIFFVIPFGVVVYYSFINGALDHGFAGLKNYVSVMQNGAFRIAVKTGAPVVPVAITGARRLAWRCCSRRASRGKASSAPSF